MNLKILFTGMTVMVLGLLIMIHDYPQIIYMQAMTSEQLQLDSIQLDKFERIQIEFYVGVGIFVSGIIMLFFSKFHPITPFKK